MFLMGGGVDEIGDAVQLQRDKGELVQVGGPKIAQESPHPTPRVVLEGLSMGGAVEWPSPFTRCDMMGTHCILQTANQ